MTNQNQWIHMDFTLHNDFSSISETEWNTLVEQGISKAGNRRTRALLVELAWSWLRFQPESALSPWFNRRFAAAGKRMRRTGIVALARRLAIALWRYLEHGVIPSGAVLKPVVA